MVLANVSNGIMTVVSSPREFSLLIIRSWSLSCGTIFLRGLTCIEGEPGLEEHIDSAGMQLS